MPGIVALLRKLGMDCSARTGIPDFPDGLTSKSSAVVTESGFNALVGERPHVASSVLTAATTTAVGGVLKWKNPEDVAILVTRVIFDVTTKSTGAATLDVGYNLAGDTSDDTLMDGLDVGTGAGVFDNIENQGTHGVSTVKMAVGGYIVATASATVAGLVGRAYIEYVKVIS